MWKYKVIITPHESLKCADPVELWHRQLLWYDLRLKEEVLKHQTRPKPFLAKLWPFTRVIVSVCQSERATNALYISLDEISVKLHILLIKLN